MEDEGRRRAAAAGGYEDITVVPHRVLLLLSVPPHGPALCPHEAAGLTVAVLKEAARVGPPIRIGGGGLGGVGPRILEAHLLALDKVVAEHGRALQQHPPILQQTTKNYVKLLFNFLNFFYLTTQSGSVTRFLKQFFGSLIQPIWVPDKQLVSLKNSFLQRYSNF